jgi:hypothetical protein
LDNLRLNLKLSTNIGFIFKNKCKQVSVAFIISESYACNEILASMIKVNVKNPKRAYLSFLKSLLLSIRILELFRQPLKMMVLNKRKRMTLRPI